MEHKKEYIAPQLTVVTFRTEQGYAASNIFSSLVFWEELDMPGEEHVESYTDHDVWNDGNGFWE